MKKYVIIPLALLFTLLLCSCSQRGVWGKYYNQADGTDVTSSVEFAYSKTFYTSDVELAKASEDSENNDYLFAGWYECDGDRIECTYSRETEDEDGKKKTEKFTMVFTYDKENDTLTGEDGKVYKKEQK